MLLTYSSFFIFEKNKSVFLTFHYTLFLRMNILGTYVKKMSNYYEVCIIIVYYHLCFTRKEDYMAWFSYFLLSVPEAFLLLAVTFTLLSISIKENLKKMILFAFLWGGVAFTFSILMNSSIKPVINFTFFAIILIVLFRFKILTGIIISLISYILLVALEIIILIPLTQVIPFEQIAASPWLRILAGVFVIHIPLLLIWFILQKFNLKIKIPLLR